MLKPKITKFSKVTADQLHIWWPMIEHGGADALYRLLMVVNDASLPGDMCELDALEAIEQGPLGKADPRYARQRERCATRLVFEITGDLQYQVR